MTRPQSSARLPEGAIHELERITKDDWREGVPLGELLKRINRVAIRFLPKEAGRDSRVKRLYTERSFRHYQTLGCIEPPEKDGRRSLYRVRHLVQALLVRKLLWERVPSDQIVGVMSRSGPRETERMLLGGVEMVARADEEGKVRSPAGAHGSDPPVPAESWLRIRVEPGAELHLRHDLLGIRRADLPRLVGRLVEVIRRFQS